MNPPASPTEFRVQSTPQNGNGRSLKTRTRGKKSPLDKARATLGALDTGDLRALAEDIADLLALLDQSGDPISDQAADFETGYVTGGAADIQRARSGGYIELKMINGCGPYKYLRRRVGGKLTSTYLGKAKSGDLGSKT